MDLEILDKDDINNLKDIYDMYSYIISKCSLSAEDYEVVQNTNNNLKKLITDLAESSGRSM